MIEKLGQIDTESIDDLIELKKKRDVMIERLDRLDDQKAKVSKIVLERVRRDYESQQAALAEQAAPLKNHARKEFAKLEELLEASQKALQATALDREELELRHQVGEFGDTAFTERRDEIAEKQAQQEQDHTEIEAVRESFVAAFDSEEDLSESVEAEPESEPQIDDSPDAELTVYDTQETARRLVMEQAAEQDEEAVAEESEENDKAELANDGTVIEALEPPEEDGNQDEAPEESEASEESVNLMQPMPPDAVPTGGTVLLSVPPPAPGEMPELGGTTVLKQARLVPVEPIAGGSEFAIEPITTIGRTKENSIRVDEPAVSRGHSQISLTNDGYLLRDLGSENGTYVNGERIESRLLEEGDRIQIGTVRFVFYDAAQN